MNTSLYPPPSLKKQNMRRKLHLPPQSLPGPSTEGMNSILNCVLNIPVFNSFSYPLMHPQTVYCLVLPISRLFINGITLYMFSRDFKKFCIFLEFVHIYVCSYSSLSLLCTQSTVLYIFIIFIIYSTFNGHLGCLPKQP